MFVLLPDYTTWQINICLFYSVVKFNVVLNVNLPLQCYSGRFNYVYINLHTLTYIFYIEKNTHYHRLSRLNAPIPNLNLYLK